MRLISKHISVTMMIMLLTATCLAQTGTLTSGDVTVQLIQGLNSAASPKGISQGRVTRSTNPAIPPGSAALLGIVSGPGSNVYTVKLLQLSVNGQTLPAASSSVTLAPDVFNKGLELTRNRNAPKDSASGSYVFLPARMIVKFTLTAVPPQQSAASSGELSRGSDASRPPHAALPQTWTIRSVQRDNGTGKEALFQGTAEANGVKQPAGLSISCITGVYSSNQPFANTHFDVYLRPAIVGFDTGYMGEKEAYHDDAGTSQLGTARMFHVDLSDGSKENGRVTIEVAYEEPNLKEAVDSPGVPLQLTLGPDPENKDIKAPPVHVSFMLPADNASLQTVMAPCFAQQAAEAAAQREKEVAVCPVVEGKVLRNISVLSGPTNKKLERDGDSDQELVYTLPKSTRARPRPKLTLVCGYMSSGYQTYSEMGLEKRPIPIPAAASSCFMDDSSNELRKRASCVR